MKKIYIALICVVTLLLIGATYRLNLFMFLSEYEEVCYANKIDIINYTCSKMHPFIYWSFSDSEIVRECDEEYIKYCEEEANYICCEATCQYENVTNICDVHHLVRKSDGLLSDNYRKHQ